MKHFPQQAPGDDRVRMRFEDRPGYQVYIIERESNSASRIRRISQRIAWLNLCLPQQGIEEYLAAERLARKDGLGAEHTCH